MSQSIINQNSEPDFFQDVVDNLPQTVYETDADGMLIYVNKWGYQEYAYEPDILKKGLSVLDTIAPQDRMRCKENIMRIIAGHEIHSNEYLAIRKDGTSFPVMIYSTCYYRDGQYAGLRGVIVNIEERITREKLLQESESRYHNLVELSPSGIIVHQDGKFVYANKTALKTMGAEDESEVLGKPVLEYVHPDDRELALERIQKVLTAGDITLAPAEERFKKMDGSYITAEVRSIPFVYQGRPAVQVVFSDISEQKQLAREKEELQHQLYHSQKLEAVGTLAGGIAHDYNNLLTVIIANTELMLLNENRNREEDLKTILHAAKTAASLTTRLLSFSRKQTHDRENFQADRIVSEMRSLLSRLLGENYSLNLVLDAPDTTIFASKSELEHILVNLAVNARDAMAQGGDIDISSSEIRISENEINTIPPLVEGKYFCITVQDYGCGMSPEVKKHLFDPFFSTKEVGKGTGLGLSTVYGIIRRHEGGIQVESEEGVGSCFKVFIPVSESEAKTSDHRINTQKHSQERTSVLLIEDDIDVRIISRQVLEDYGYQVFSVSGIEEAYEVFEKHKNEFKLIIADIRLPDGTGLEFADVIQAQNVHLPILFISGYDLMSPEELIKESFIRKFLPKPFDPSGLIQAIQDISPDK